MRKQGYLFLAICGLLFSRSGFAEKMSGPPPLYRRIASAMPYAMPTRSADEEVVEANDVLGVIEFLWKNSPTGPEKLSFIQGSSRGKCVVRKGNSVSPSSLATTARSLTEDEMGPWQAMVSEIVTGRFESFPDKLRRDGTLLTSSAFVFSPSTNSPSLSVAEGDFLPIEFQAETKSFGRVYESLNRGSFTKKEFGVRVAKASDGAVTLVTKGFLERGSPTFAEREEALCILKKIQ